MTALRMPPLLVVSLLWASALLYIASAPAQGIEAGTPRQADKSDPQSSTHKQAALEAQKKAESDPSEDNLFLYASSLMKLDYPSAEKIYRFGISKYPDSVRLHAGLASALWALGRPDEGAEELCRAAELAPTDPHPLEFLVATEHIPASLSQKVATGLWQLRRRYPQDGLILFDYEMVVSNRYSANSPIPEDFVATLKEAIRLTPNLPEAYFQLSLVHEQQKEYTQELEALRHAVQLAPQDEHYRYNLAMLYKKLGDTAAFQRELSVFLKLHNASSKSTLEHAPPG